MTCTSSLPGAMFTWSATQQSSRLTTLSNIITINNTGSSSSILTLKNINFTGSNIIKCTIDYPKESIIGTEIDTTILAESKLVQFLYV